MSYNRVLPRDLFNEAKLLKCLGHLTLKIHDNNNPFNLSFEHNGNPFKIRLMELEGYLTVDNIYFKMNDLPLTFITQYNSKRNFPLYVYYELCEYPVFDDNGDWDEEFADFFNDTFA